MGAVAALVRDTPTTGVACARLIGSNGRQSRTDTTLVAHRAGLEHYPTALQFLDGGGQSSGVRGGAFIKPVDALDLNVLKGDAVRSFARLHLTVTRTSAWTQHRRRDSTPPATGSLRNAVSNHFRYSRFSPNVVTVLGRQRITFSLKNHDDIGHELIVGSPSNSTTGTLIVRSRAACIL